MIARTQVLLRSLVAIGLLLVLATRADFFRTGVSSPRDAAFGVVGAVVLLAVAQGLSALRWRLILGANVPPWSFLFRLYLIGQFFGLFLPTSVGGDALRAVAISKTAVSAAEAISSVLLDRLLGVAALALYLLGGVLISPITPDLIGRVRWTSPSHALLGLAVVTLIAAAVVIARARNSDRGRLLIGEGLTLARRLAASPGILLSAAAVSLAVQAVYIAVWGGLAAAVGLVLPVGFLLVAVPVVSLAAMLPITISGLGVREGTWVLLCGLIGLPAAAAVAVSLLYFLAFAIVGAFGGVLFMARGTHPPLRQS